MKALRPRTLLERRAVRWLTVGSWAYRHWRGVLLALYALVVAIFGLIAQWGYDNRDRGWGSFLLLAGGMIAAFMIFRFPRRLTASMRRERLRRKAAGPVGRRPGVVPGRRPGVVPGARPGVVDVPGHTAPLRSPGPLPPGT